MGSLATIKKSQGFESWFFVIVVLLAFALFFVVLNYTWGKVSPELESGLNSSIPTGFLLDYRPDDGTIRQTRNSGKTHGR